MAAESQNDKPQCTELPKLSSLEFTEYNKMSEHMNYYVKQSLDLGYVSELTCDSTITFDKHGPYSTKPARQTPDLQACQYDNLLKPVSISAIIWDYTMELKSSTSFLYLLQECQRFKRN